MEDKYGTKILKGMQLISEAVPGVQVDVIDARGKRVMIRQYSGKQKVYTLTQKEMMSSSWKVRKPLRA